MSEKISPILIIAILFIALSAGMVFYFTQYKSTLRTNPGSRYATAEALIDHGTFAIDKTLYARKIGSWGHDSVKIGEHFYSTKPPMLSVLTAQIYWLYKTVTGKSFRYYRLDVTRFCNRVMAGIPHIFLLVFFYRLMLLMVRREEAVIVALAGICFSFIGVGYATDLNNHSVAAAILLIGFYYAFRIRNEINVKPGHWIISGFLLGLLPTIEIPPLFISTFIGIYLLTYNRKKTLLFFFPAAMIPILIHFALTYISTGSFLPVNMRHDLFYFEGSYWSAHYEQEKAAEDPRLIYVFHILLGHHGIFSMTPAFILSVIALARVIKRRASLLPEAQVIALSGLTLIIFYIVITDGYGGKCVGFRWMIVLMPLLFVFFGVWVEQSLEIKRRQTWMWVLVLITILIGQYHTLDALKNPWKNSRWQKFIKILQPVEKTI